MLRVIQYIVNPNSINDSTKYKYITNNSCLFPDTCIIMGLLDSLNN